MVLYSSNALTEVFNGNTTLLTKNIEGQISATNDALSASGIDDLTIVIVHVDEVSNIPG